MGEKERKLWRRAITRVVLKNRLSAPPQLGLTPLDREIHIKLSDGDPQLVGEFEHYRWFDEGREELRAVVGGPGKPLHGKYIYVLALNRKLYVYPEPPGVGGGRDDEFRHSAFLAGRPVLSAGQLFVWRGQVVLVDNSSGHYKPHSNSMSFILKWLDSQVDMTMAVVTTYGKDETHSFDAKDFAVRGPTAKPLKDVPDVENLFKYALDYEEVGKPFGSFAEALDSYQEQQRLKREKIVVQKKLREDELRKKKEREVEALKKREVEALQRKEILEKQRLERELAQQKMREDLKKKKEDNK